jgi:acetylornithine deacetylase/succinyl-diaminopimelate desuccinylase-like protein
LLKPLRLLLSRPSYEGSADSAIARAVLTAAGERLGHSPKISGAAYWMDAALIAEAGIETVVIGAVGGGAHAALEWVDLDSVETLAGILRTRRSLHGISAASRLGELLEQLGLLGRQLVGRLT